MASASWVAMSPGIGAPALGGRELRRRARDDATGVHRLGQLGEPGGVLLLDAVGQRLAELGRQGLGLVVATGVAGGVDDRSEVAEVELVDDRHGGLGAVAPGRGGGLAPQLFGDAQEGVGLDLGLARGLQLFVLLLDGLADGRDATGEQLLGDGALLGRHRLEERGAVGLARAEALGLRLLFDGRRCGAGGTLVAPLLAVRAHGRVRRSVDQGRRRPPSRRTFAVAPAVVAPTALAGARSGPASR